MQRSLAISLSMFSVVHGRFVVRLFVVFVGVALRAASILKNRDFCLINYLSFCARRPAGGLDFEKT